MADGCGDALEVEAAPAEEKQEAAAAPKVADLDPDVDEAAAPEAEKPDAENEKAEDVPVAEAHGSAANHAFADAEAVDPAEEDENEVGGPEAMFEHAKSFSGCTATALPWTKICTRPLG